jgi:FKBP-type peptidyl-prolyl cis-trans isomerase
LCPQVLAEGYQSTADGLIYKDFEEGQGEAPVDGQEVRA